MSLGANLGTKTPEMASQVRSSCPQEPRRDGVDCLGELLVRFLRPLPLGVIAELDGGVVADLRCCSSVLSAFQSAFAIALGKMVIMAGQHLAECAQAH